MNKILNQTKKILASAALLLLIQVASRAQSTYTGSTVDLTVSGTSTLHDWNMKSAKANCTAAFTFNSAGQITGISSLEFSTPAISLKSDHSAMDKNAYKALKTDKNPAIVYTLSTATVTPGEGGSVTIRSKGKLAIAGAAKEEEIVAVVKANADNTVTVSGSRTISMKDFNMEPPTFMLGAVKTGNDVTLKFTMTLKKS